MNRVNLFALNVLIAAYSCFAQTWSPLGNGVNSKVLSLAVYNNELYASGYFTYASGTHTNNIAKWNGLSWDSVGAQSVASGNISAITVYNGKLYCNDPNSGVREWNGTNWHSIGGGNGGPLNVLAVYNNELYAGWQATPYSGLAISKWNGTTWSNLGTGISCNCSGLYSSVRSFAIYNGELYVGGYFNNAGGNAVSNIAKWNGTTWGVLPTVANYPIINALSVYNGQLYIGSASPNYISKWNGTILDTVNSGMNGAVRSFCVYDSILYVGGAFTTAGGNVTGNIAKWNGTTWSSAGAVIDSFCVYTMCVYNNQLYAAGSFINAGATLVNNIAKLDTVTYGIKKLLFTNNIYIYPNPAQNNFTVEVTGNQTQQLQVLDISGKQVLQQTITGTTTIDANRLENGVYFVQLKNNAGISTQKIIVQH